MLQPRSTLLDYEAAFISTDLFHIIETVAHEPPRGIEAGSQRRLQLHAQGVCARTLRVAIVAQDEFSVWELFYGILNAHCEVGVPKEVGFGELCSEFEGALQLSFDFVFSSCISGQLVKSLLKDCFAARCFFLPGSAQVVKAQRLWVHEWLAATSQWDLEPFEDSRHDLYGSLLGQFTAEWESVLDSGLLMTLRRDLAEVDIRHTLAHNNLNGCAKACVEAWRRGVSSESIITSRRQLCELWAEQVAISTAHWNECDPERVLELCDWAEEIGIILPSVLAECRQQAAETYLQRALDDEDCVELLTACSRAVQYGVSSDRYKLARKTCKGLLRDAVATACQDYDLVDLQKFYWSAEAMLDPSQKRALRRRIGILRKEHVMTRMTELASAILAGWERLPREVQRVGEIVDYIQQVHKQVEVVRKALDEYWSILPGMCSGIESIGLACAGFPGQVDDDLGHDLAKAMLSASHTKDAHSLWRACVVAEESGVEEACVHEAKTKVGELWLEQGVDELSPDVLGAAAEWVEEEGICTKALDGCKVTLEYYLEFFIDDWNDLPWVYESALRVGVHESALGAARAQLSSHRLEAAKASLERAAPWKALELCAAAQQLKLDDPLWMSIREEAKALLDAELTLGISTRRPQRTLWACDVGHGSKVAGIEAVRILGAREQAINILLDEVRNAIASDSACQIAHAVHEAKSARGPFTKCDVQTLQSAEDRLKQLRARAEAIEMMMSDNPLRALSPINRRSVGGHCSLAQLVCRIVIARAAVLDGRAAGLNRRATFDPNGGDEGSEVRTSNPNDFLTSALDVGPLHRRSGCLLAHLLAASPRLESCLQVLSSRAIFSQKFSRAYSLDDCDYGFRSGRPSYKPAGWMRWSLEVDNFDLYRYWHVCYHGTRISNALSILAHGLRQPGRDGVVVLHGQAYSDTYASIYLSEAIGYASHPVYSQFFRFADEHWGQIVFQCRVRPGTYKAVPGTLGTKYWIEGVRLDQNFPSLNHLEWLVEDPHDVIVTGLMLREFGANADPAIYGPLACSVTAGEHGPEFDWSRRIATDLKNKGMMIAAN